MEQRTEPLPSVIADAGRQGKIAPGQRAAKYCRPLRDWVSCGEWQFDSAMPSSSGLRCR